MGQTFSGAADPRADLLSLSLPALVSASKEITVDEEEDCWSSRGDKKEEGRGIWWMGWGRLGGGGVKKRVKKGHFIRYKGPFFFLSLVSSFLNVKITLIINNLWSPMESHSF